MFISSYVVVCCCCTDSLGIDALLVLSLCVDNMQIASLYEVWVFLCGAKEIFHVDGNFMKLQFLVALIGQDVP